MSLNTFDIVKVDNPSHIAFGKEVYILEKDQEINMYACLTKEKLICYVQDCDIELIKSPRIENIPSYVLEYEI